MANYNVNDKNTREYQENLYQGSRHNLLVVLIFTVVNLVMLLTGSGNYWLFSASIPYYLTAFGMMFDGYMNTLEPVIGTFTITALVIAVIILAVYLVCWIMSKKRSGWLIVALVLFAVDTLGMLAMMLISGSGIAEWIMDIVFHAWVLISLSRGLIAASKLKNMPETAEMPIPPQYTGPDLDA